MMFALIVSAFAGGDPCTSADAAPAAERLKALAEEWRSNGSVEKSGISEVKKLDKKGLLCSGEDQFNAALVLSASTDAADVARAYDVAQLSMTARYANGPWIVGLTFDRLRVSEGQYQAYGTQTRPDGTRTCLLWVDPAVTDEQRAEYGHPALSATYRTILDANGFPAAEPTLASVKLHELYCKPLPWGSAREVALVEPE
jgi:hypothetical protein